MKLDSLKHPLGDLLEKPSLAVQSAIERVDILIASSNVADGAKEGLSEARALLEESLRSLAITERYIVFGEDKKPNVAPTLYEGLPTGQVSLKDKVDSLVKESQILGPLYKQGFTFNSLYKFSDGEVSLAEAIGDKFIKLSGPLRALRSPKRDEKDDRFTIAFPERDDVAFIELLKLNGRFKFVDIKALKFKAKDGHYFPLKSTMESKVKSDQTGIFSFKFTSGTARSIILGDWMTSYVYGIVKDQLRRMDIESELYAKLSYRAPGDVIAHSSDFDVISRYGDSVIMFECKSGRLTPENAPAIIRKAEELAAALNPRISGGQTFESHLVYDPFVNDPDEVRALFDASDINVLAPSDVRRLVIDVISSAT